MEDDDWVGSESRADDALLQPASPVARATLPSLRKRRREDVSLDIVVCPFSWNCCVFCGLGSDSKTPSCHAPISTGDESGVHGHDSDSLALDCSMYHVVPLEFPPRRCIRNEVDESSSSAAIAAPIRFADTSNSSAMCLLLTNADPLLATSLSLRYS